MRAARSVWTVSMLALCFFSIALLRLARIRQGTPPLPYPAPPIIPSPRSASESARREARRSWTRAREAAARELETLEDWDPETNADPHREAWLRRLMAADRSGDLRRAYSAAARAARLARAPQERFEAALLLSRIDCDLGRHKEELEEARLLMRLAPHDLQSLGVLQRAAGCNGLKPLVEQASAELKTIVDARQRPGRVVELDDAFRLPRRCPRSRLPGSRR